MVELASSSLDEEDDGSSAVPVLFVVSMDRVLDPRGPRGPNDGTAQDESDVVEEEVDFERSSSEFGSVVLGVSLGDGSKGREVLLTATRRRTNGLGR